MKNEIQKAGRCYIIRVYTESDKRHTTGFITKYSHGWGSDRRDFDIAKDIGLSVIFHTIKEAETFLALCRKTMKPIKNANTIFYISKAFYTTMRGGPRATRLTKPDRYDFLTRI